VRDRLLLEKALAHCGGVPNSLFATNSSWEIA
jgi:hypothetical protein